MEKKKKYEESDTRGILKMITIHIETYYMSAWRYLHREEKFLNITTYC